MSQHANVKTNQQPITGIPGIDEQHKEFFALLDALQDHLEKENPSFDFVCTSIQKIMESLKAHFAVEESLMEMIGFPKLGDHKIQHEKCYRQVSDAVETLGKSKNLNIIDTISSMRDAALEHVTVFDVEYSAHIENLIELKQKYNITAIKAQILTK